MRLGWGLVGWMVWIDVWISPLSLSKKGLCQQSDSCDNALQSNGAETPPKYEYELCSSNRHSWLLLNTKMAATPTTTTKMPPNICFVDSLDSVLLLPLNSLYICLSLSILHSLSLQHKWDAMRGHTLHYSHSICTICTIGLVSR